MNTRSRLIAGGVIVLIAAVLVLVLTQVDLPGGENDQTPTPATLPALFPEAEFQVVTSVTVTNHQTGETFSAHTEDGETWQIDEAPADADLSQPVNHDRIGGVLVSLPGMKPLRAFENVEDLEAYGLENPAYTISYQLAEGGEYTFLVGEQAPTGSGYYGQPQDAADDSVYLLPEYVVGALTTFTPDVPVAPPTPEGGAALTPTP